MVSFCRPCVYLDEPFRNYRGMCLMQNEGCCVKMPKFNSKTSLKFLFLKYLTYVWKYPKNSIDDVRSVVKYI